MKSTKHTLLFSALALLSLFSCKDDSDETTTGTDSSSSKYVVCLRDGSNTSNNSDYMITLDDLMSGEITAEGQGVELSGWNYLEYFGDSYFTIDATNDITTGYNFSDGSFSQTGQFSADAMSSFQAIDDNYFLSIGAAWGGGSYNCDFQLIDINNTYISSTIQDPIYENYYTDGESTDQLNCWPTGCYMENNKLFVFFYTLNGNTWETPVTDTAYCSVYTYEDETFTYETTFKDSRTSPVGYYCEQPCILEDEDGNHYTISTSSLAAGYTQATKPSGILRINAGEEVFDEDYFFNVEDNFNYKVMSAVYVSDGNIVANVISTDNDTEENSWAAFTIASSLLETAIINVEDQTFTLVSDVPAHGGQYHTPMLVEDGMVYMSVNNGTDAYIYQVDASTATATQGAKIVGDELQAIIAN